jgi:hypothetical protein
MENTRIVNVEFPTGVFTEHIIIDREDGSQLTMLKSTYDAQQAEQSTPSVIDEA